MPLLSQHFRGDTQLEATLVSDPAHLVVRKSRARSAAARGGPGDGGRRVTVLAPPGRIVCVGDIDMDLLIAVPRLPKPDEKISGRRIALTPGGMAANTAVALARLGAKSTMVGAVGDDDSGEAARSALAAEGVDCAHVAIRLGAETFTCVILVDGSGEKALIRIESPTFLPLQNEVPSRAFEGAVHVHMTFTDPDLHAITVSHAKQAGATISLDLEAADLPGEADTLKELLAPLDCLFLSGSTREVAEKRFGSLPLPPGCRVITTLGAKGAAIDGPGGSFRVAGLDVRALDTSGAGDTLAAAFLFRHLGGASDSDALLFANAAAALSTLACGAQSGAPRLEQVLAVLDSGRVDA